MISHFTGILNCKLVIGDFLQAKYSRALVNACIDFYL